ncbi:MAG: peptide MFS transporter [Phycisphaerales bacterium]|nr:peptide MFS transporter [Phycisphaerales bacterium]
MNHTPAAAGTILGHPRGLFVLFFAEMWERFSFYGMKALLILYLVNYLFWRQGEASHLFAWYTGLVYLTPVAGGWVADKWLGARWSVVIGGVIIAIGHFLLAFEPMPFFYSGLGCLVVGTGFLKPNISTQVGAMYRATDERRDSAFTLFYMGINTGAFLGPIVCGWLQTTYSYHHGFAAAGVGMVLGLIVYIMGMKTVRDQERRIAEPEKADADEKATGEPSTSREEPMHATGVPLSKVYRDRSIFLVVICMFAILFWIGFEQASNVMNLWADQNTNLHVFRAESPPVTLPGEAPPPPQGGLADWRMGAALSQSINPLFIIIFAGVFAWLWQFLDRRRLQPSTPMKMGIAMVFLAIAFGVMLLAVRAEGRPVSAPLSALPPGIQVGSQGNLYSVEKGERVEDRTDYGCTRLRWADGSLAMTGVLTDIDWMRALGASSNEAYRAAVAELSKQADAKAEEARVLKLQRKTKKEVGADADIPWEVSVTLPAAAGDAEPVAGWPTKTVDGKEMAKVRWDPSTRTLALSDTLASDRDKAQVLAAGAEPTFRRALTDVYRQSSVSRVSIGWLLMFYLILTIGELCCSPVGLSLVTKAAPPKYVGLFMGVWFVCTGAIANYAAHTAGGYWGTMEPTTYFMIFGAVGVGAAVLMLLMIKALKPKMHGIH